MPWLTQILHLPSLLRSVLNLLSVTQNYKSRGRRPPGRVGFCVFEGTVQDSSDMGRGENLIQELSKDCMYVSIATKASENFELGGENFGGFSVLF